MEQAPWAPYGTGTLSTFVSSDDRPRQGHLQPDLRPGPDQLPVQVAARRCFTIGGVAAELQPAAARPARRRGPQPLAPGPGGGCAATGSRSPSSALFVLIVVFVLAAPLWANDVAHTGPNDDPHAGEDRRRRRKARSRQPRRQADRPASGSSAGGKFFLGADGRLGRDEMVRLMYGGRTSLFIGIVAALITTVLAIVLGLLAGYYRGWVDAVISRTLDVIWAFPVLLLGDRARHRARGRRPARSARSTISGGSIWIPILIIGVVYIALHGAADPRRGAGAARERVRRGRGRPGRRAAAGDVRRAAAQPLLDDHRLLHPQHRQQHAARGGALLPRRRRAAARTPPGGR